MSYEISVVEAYATPIASVTRRATLENLGDVLMPAFDEVWRALRAVGASTGQNLVIYRPITSEEMDIEVGVEVHDPSQLEEGSVARSTSPAGKAAKVLHTGPYDLLIGAHEAIQDWAAEQGRALGATAWEVYGDWSQDPEQLVTEVYYLLSE